MFLRLYSFFPNFKKKKSPLQSGMSNGTCASSSGLSRLHSFTVKELLYKDLTKCHRLNPRSCSELVQVKLLSQAFFFLTALPPAWPERAGSMVSAWQSPAAGSWARLGAAHIGAWFSRPASSASVGWQVSRKGVCVLAKSWRFKEMHGS